jgi:5-(carboxyamino)imidazole ribonucleotide synthase
VRRRSSTTIPPPAGGPFGPGATVGVLGGGQLGRMMAIAARQMGLRIVVLDPSPRCPTAQFADGIVVGALDDVEAATHLAKQCDVITLDTEHVPADVLDAIHLVTPVRPGPTVLRTIQDRLVQKTFLDRIEMPQTAWASVETLDELDAALGQLGRPAILKVRRAGYDGKGQVRIDPGTDARALASRLKPKSAVSRDGFEPSSGLEPCVLESLVPFTREVSVILARGLDGAVAVYPIAENVHRKHVLHTTRAPAPMPDAQRDEAIRIAVAIAQELDCVGVMAVEMFELADGRLLVNEIAPRTHNSGHYTYGACVTSQFEQHIRAVAGLPLGDPSATTGAVMVNLIGDLWSAGPPAWQHVLARPEAKLHLYGKDAPAPGRKMGHVTLLDRDTDRALATAEALIEALTPRS